MKLALQRNKIINSNRTYIEEIRTFKFCSVLYEYSSILYLGAIEVIRFGIG